MTMSTQAIVDGTDAVEAFRVGGNLRIDIKDGRVVAFGDPVTGRSTPVRVSNGVGYVALVFDPLGEWSDKPSVSLNPAN